MPPAVVLPPKRPGDRDITVEARQLAPGDIVLRSGQVVADVRFAGAVVYVRYTRELRSYPVPRRGQWKIRRHRRRWALATLFGELAEAMGRG